MKYVKMLGLAAVAAAALMAFVGASTASATVLCTEAVNTTTGTCAATKAEPATTEIHAVNVGVVKLDTSFKNIECSKSTIKGKTENEGSGTETVKGPDTASVPPETMTLTFEECNCTVNVLSGGDLEIHWIPNTDNGTMTSSGASVTTVCSTIFGNVHCIYTTNNTHLGELTASANATSPAIFHSNATIPVSETDSLCPKESKWTATYEVTTPTPLYVGKET